MAVDGDVIEGSDPTIRPQDDLFGHVNGGWLKEVEIPPDLPMIGAFITLALEAEAQVDDILQESRASSRRPATCRPGSASQMIGDLYASFLDEDAVEALGATPLADDLAAIDAVTSVSEFVGLLGRLERTGVGGAARRCVNTDDRQSDRYVVNFFQGGIGLPDESYYREDAHAETRSKYVAHIAAMFGLLGDSEAEAADAAGRVMALETRLALGHWDNVASRDVVKTYNLMTRDELEAAAPGFDWAAWEQGMQAPEHRAERGRRPAAELPRRR